MLLFYKSGYFGKILTSVRNGDGNTVTTRNKSNIMQDFIQCARAFFFSDQTYFNLDVHILTTMKYSITVIHSFTPSQ